MELERRGKGWGQVRWVESRGEFEYRLRVTLANGEKGRKSVYAKNKTQLGKKADELKAKAAANELTLNPKKAQKLSEYLLGWYRSDARPKKESTYQVRSTNIKRISSVMGGLDVDRVSIAHIKRCDRALAESGLSSSSRKQALAVLRKALGSAYAEGIIPSNPFQKWQRDWTPEPDEREVRALTMLEQAQLLGLKDGWTPLWEVQLVTGMRIGETLGLKWSDIDLPENEDGYGVIHITKAIHRRRKGMAVRKEWLGHGDTFYLDKPKTSRATRDIRISPTVCQLFRSIKARQDEERARLGGAWEDLGFVFTWHRNKRGGQPIFVDNAGRNLQRTMEVGGLTFHIGVHMFRHTFITDQINAGVNVGDVSKYVGHSSVAFTMDVYKSFMEDDKTALADTASRLLEEVRKMASLQEVAHAK